MKKNVCILAFVLLAFIGFSENIKAQPFSSPVEYSATLNLLVANHDPFNRDYTLIGCRAEGANYAMVEAFSYDGTAERARYFPEMGHWIITAGYIPPQIITGANPIFYVKIILRNYNGKSLIVSVPPGKSSVSFTIKNGELDVNVGL